MSEPSSPYGRLLNQRARQLIQSLEQAGVAAKLQDKSLRTYSLKIDIQGAGALNLYYSPKKKRFRLGGHELTDGEIWPRITVHWDGDLGKAPADTGPSRSSQKNLLETPDPKAAGQSAYAAYVDGSYMQGRIGYGAVILKAGRVVWETSGRVPREMGGMRQVGGELTAVMEVVREQFRPEFINRLDEIVVFHPLGRDQIRAITDIQARYLRERLVERGMDLKLTPAALDRLGEAGFDPVYGARPLKRAIRQQLENPLAQEILSGRFGPDDVIEVDVAEKGLVFRKA